MDSDDQIDIRSRIRAHTLRQLAIARMSAPDNWQDELREALVAQRAVPSMWARGSDFRLFIESFAIFFVAAMAFLI